MFRDPAGIPNGRKTGRVPEEGPKDIWTWKCPDRNKTNEKKQKESVHGSDPSSADRRVGKDQIQTRAVAGSSPLLGARLRN